MPCYHPLTAYRNSEARGGITFSAATGTIPLKIPCNQCIGCRLERSRQWAMRCVHEASLHKDNSFITLTYNDQHIPPTGTLVIKHFQDFMKRLRKSQPNTRIRYYHCGEYGDLNRRPHYHALLFGFQFPDLELFQTKKGNKIYTSATLEKLWTFGFSTIGALTFESAAYCARYVMKKKTGKQAPAYYRNIDKTTGEYWDIIPEYNTMSRRPGIAHDWYQLYKNDAYPSDFITLRGKKMKPPKYYDRLFEHDAPQTMQLIKEARMASAKLRAKDNTPARLLVRENVKKAQIASFSRKL